MENERPPIKPVMLVILDGWGLRTMEHANAPVLANTPNYDRWMTSRERTVVHASEEEVGLVPGQMGNSEVGHLNLGAGRVVFQDISRINIAIREHTLGSLDDMQATFSHVKQNGGNLHLIGLVSDGGVHSHIDHLIALLDITKNAGVNPVIHVITDGRDTPTDSGAGFVQQIEDYIATNNHGRIATVSGRYYAMDRDKRWERTQRAFDALTRRVGHTAESASAALQYSYSNEKTDEFVEPYVIGSDDNLALQSGDAVLCYNFRADRMRQIATLFSGVKPDGYAGDIVDNLFLTTFTEYADEIDADHILFGKDNLKNTLAEVLSNAGKTQYHTAETEKYPHVTFFFNGRREEPWEGETRKIVPSPKVATYDLQPEMSAHELTDATLKRLDEAADDFLLVNFANPDMVGHTGDLAAAIRACETVDECVGELVNKVAGMGGAVIITADHGNCDRMIDEITQEPHTYHTTQPVPLFVISDHYFFEMKPFGKLADVAPTVLHLLGVDKPDDMTGESLVERHREI
ncbi:MAG: 2,3-bisphosphoglycerate-independent phosphoglycerate mutase [Chloroflexota bacterium]